MKINAYATLVTLSLLSGLRLAAAQGTAITYQGRLISGDSLATGSYDFRVTVHDAVSEGTPVAGPLTNAAVAVTDGLFTLDLDFGEGVFTGASRWLEMGVRTNGGDAFVVLSPRQKLTATPYAIAANHLSGTLAATQLTGTVPSAQLGGLYSDSVTFSNGANLFVGSGAGLTGVNAATLGGMAAMDFWQLGGNAGTTAGMNFLGTTDAQPLEFKINGQRALRLEPVTLDGTNRAPNVIGGSVDNSVTIGTYGATIGGGETNAVHDYAHYGTIGGGRNNWIGTNALFAIIAGGTNNTNQSSGPLAPELTNLTACTIGGGAGNAIQKATGCTIGGGMGNWICVDSNGLTQVRVSTIGGGLSNIVYGTVHATVGGGSGNFIGFEADSATIGGGLGNTVNDYALRSTIGGGESNIVTDWYGTIPGGKNNAASGFAAFAAGSGAKANHNGAFVWADSTAGDFASGANNEAAFRCNGGVRFTSGAGGANQTVFWKPGSASWNFTSDRASKEGLALVRGREVLDKLSRLPIAEWNYIGYPQRHIGPMAQDFHALFPLNESETTLNSADLDGVALAAIQGLNEVVQEKDAKIQELRREVDELRSLVRQLIERSEGSGR